jgi:hypothetical protein
MRKHQPLNWGMFQNIRLLVPLAAAEEEGEGVAARGPILSGPQGLVGAVRQEHSEHSSLIGSRVNSTYFAQNSTSLVAAYGPAQIRVDAATNQGRVFAVLGSQTSHEEGDLGRLGVAGYQIPEVSSTQSWAQWAYRFESTVTGAFIGLAG